MSEDNKFDFKTAIIKDRPVQMNIDMSAAMLVRFCHGLSDQAGWWNGVDKSDLNVRAAKLCLVHSEISEALEGMRKGINDDHLPSRPMEEVELADAVIRICDYAGAMGFDLGGAIVEKLQYNQSRSDHKLENRQEPGGKSI